MAWAAIDDRMPWHPKIIGLSDKGFRCWICAIAYCQAYRTGGNIPKSALESIPRATQTTALELVAAGLWHVTDAGWSVHDFDNYNPERIQKNLRQRRWRDGKNDADVDADVDAGSSTLPPTRA